MTGYSAPLSVVAFIATTRKDAERGPQVRMNSDEAAKRLLNSGDLAWVHGPRRVELATVLVDNSVGRGAVVLRDVVGASPSELVRVVNVELNRAEK